MTIKVVLADDQYLMLEGIKAILKHEPEIEVVGTAQDGKSAIAQVLKLRPDLVLIDIEMPKMNGIVATKYICQNIPNTRVIVLTSHKKQSYITEALRAGASGYLLKNTLIQDLKQAIHSLSQGNSSVKVKLLTQAVDRINAAKVAKYPEKVVYLKKHRKSIYKPAINKRSKIKSKAKKRVSATNSATTGITKASLAPIFESPTTPDLLMVNRGASQPSIPKPPQFNRRQYLKRIALMLMAIASFVLSIIIF